MNYADKLRRWLYILSKCDNDVLMALDVYNDVEKYEKEPPCKSIDHQVLIGAIEDFLSFHKAAHVITKGHIRAWADYHQLDADWGLNQSWRKFVD